MPRKSSRREFLKGKAAAETLADAARPLLAEENAESLQPDVPTVHVTRRAMATEFELQFPDDPKKNFTELALEAFEELEKIEEQLSFFRVTSELSRINLLADQEPVEVEPELFDLLTLAMQLWRDTGGAWDLTSTPLWKIWGFAKRKGKIPAPDEIEEAMQLVGSQYIELDADRKTIFFTQTGVKLNLGSIGKGYAIDRCATRLLEGGMTNFLLHGGQSSILAHGSYMQNKKKGSELFISEIDPGQKDLPREISEINRSDPFFPFWQINLPHPIRSDQRLGEIHLSNKALGTSNSRFQSFRHEGKLYGHILDPRTGYPAQQVLSATVLAPTATLADALSTAFYVLGPDKTSEYCQTHPDVSAILLLPAEKGGCEVFTIGLKPEEFQPFSS